MKKTNKPAKNVLKKEEPKVRMDPRVEEIYEEIVEFMCPVRGLVKQKVKIKRYKYLVSTVKPILDASDLAAKIEEKDDGLSIYSSPTLEE